MCAPLLGRKHAQRLKRLVRLVRRAAGSVRDLDLLQLHAGQQFSGTVRKFALAEIARRRVSADQQLRDAFRSTHNGEKLQKLWQKIERRLHAKRRRRRYKRPWRKWCRLTLAPLVEEVSRGVLPGTTDVHLWHQYRIAGKRLRYAWEIAAGVAPAAQRKAWCAQLAVLQEQLGAMNDRAQRLAFLESLRDEASTKALRGRVEKCLEKEQAALREQLNSLATSPPGAAADKPSAAQAETESGSDERSTILPLRRRPRRRGDTA
jgi:CHAD domain-containing protein